MLKRILTALALCFLTLPALAQGLIIGQPGQGLIIQNGGSSTLTIGTTAISGGTLNNCLTVGASNLLGQGSCGTTYTAGSGLTLTGAAFSLGDANLTYSGGALSTTSLALGSAGTLSGSAANALELINGTSAQSFRVYNTWSASGANYERGVFDWLTTANVLTIGTTYGGSGTAARNIQFVVGGVDKADYGVTSAGGWTFVGTINNLTFGYGGGGISSNTAVGVNALPNNTAGYSNSAVGLNALYSNTTGYSNSAVGLSSLYSNTTGYNNSAIGLNALYSNATGNANSAVGASALYHNTTGSSNSAYGVNALYNNTTGGNNSAVGVSALLNNTTGTNNSAVGASALYHNTTGGSNNAIGLYALYNNTTGSNNSAYGVNALYNNTTGGNDSAVGSSSLFDLGTVQTAGAFVVGVNYTITTIGTTDFTLIGASSNTVGITFTATGVGTGTGTATPNTNGNTALGQNTGRGIVYGSNNTILGANVTGLAAGLTGSVILATGDGGIKADYGKTTSGVWTLASALSATAYNVGATAGVSCAANSIAILTFTVTNGIVTHC